MINGNPSDSFHHLQNRKETQYMKKQKMKKSKSTFYKSQIEFFEDKFHAILFYYTFQRKALKVKIRIQRSHFFNAYAK